MAQIIAHTRWMADTYSLTSPRSDLLKRVDAALLAHEKQPGEATLKALREALDRWRFDQSRQGKDWTKSVRNQKGAVTALHRALNTVDKRQLTKEEREALDYIALQQRLALQKQFMGRKLQFKRNTVLGMASSARTNWERFKTGASTVVVDGGGLAVKGAIAGRSLAQMPARVATLQGGGVSAVHQAAQSDAMSLRPKIIAFIKELCPGVEPQGVFDALNLGAVEQFAANLAPFLGTISSGGKALIGWASVAKLAYDRSEVRDRRFAIRPGDPEAAFEAVLLLLDREIAATSQKAAVHSVAFTGKALGVFADGGAVTGPVLGALETLAQIFQTIVEYVRDYKEVQRANRALLLGALNIDLFRTCPVLGCYFLVVQDHSTIINFAVADYGTPNWMLDVERLVKQIQLVLEKARHYIKVSRFEIPRMENAKGIREANWSHKTGLDKVTSAPGAALGSVADAISGGIDRVLGSGTPLPKVDKSRIVGLGPADFKV
jgi:hypothetical protein